MPPYPIRLLLGENGEIGIFVCPLGTESGAEAVLLFNKCLFVYYSPVGLVNVNLTGYQSWVIWRSVPWVAPLKRVGY